jgi:hypothetical protein
VSKAGGPTPTLSLVALTPRPRGRPFCLPFCVTGERHGARTDCPKTLDICASAVRDGDSLRTRNYTHSLSFALSLSLSHSLFLRLGTESERESERLQARAPLWGRRTHASSTMQLRSYVVRGSHLTCTAVPLALAPARGAPSLSPFPSTFSSLAGLRYSRFRSAPTLPVAASIARRSDSVAPRALVHNRFVRLVPSILPPTACAFISAFAILGLLHAPNPNVADAAATLA